MAFQGSCCMLEQLYQHLPPLAVPRSSTALVAMLAATCAVGTVFVMSLFIGYPVPFTMVLGSIPWVAVTFGLSFIIKRQQFREHPPLTSSVRRYLAATACQVSLIFVYPIYNFFKSLSSWNQTACVLLLPVIKVVAKNWISRALPDSDDVKPGAVVFNVEIFHALFVSLCMGNTSSSRTIVALMAVDLIHAWLSFYDMMCIVQDLDPIFTKMAMPDHSSSPRRRVRSLVTISDEVLQHASSPERVTQHQPHATNWRGRALKIISLSRSVFAPKHVAPVQIASFASVAPLPGPSLVTEKHPDPTDLTALSEHERARLVLQTQKLLYATEFIVLIEYVEVIMPAMYSIFLVALFCLPNRAYYPFLEGILSYSDLAPKVGHVLLYASCELGSLVVMTGIVWWKLKLSLVHQLAFVLERRAANIHAKLLLWVVFIVQNSIVQLGADYSCDLHGSTSTMSE